MMTATLTFILPALQVLIIILILCPKNFWGKELGDPVSPNPKILILCPQNLSPYTGTQYCPVPPKFWGKELGDPVSPKCISLYWNTVLDPIPPYKNFGPKGTL